MTTKVLLTILFATLLIVSSHQADVVINQLTGVSTTNLVYSGLLPYINTPAPNVKGAPNVTKRDGKVVEFDGEKIKIAIQKANNETNELTNDEVIAVAEAVIAKIDKNPVHVEEIQDLVEMELMRQDFPVTAKAYILYRAEQIRSRKRDIFKPRKTLKPYEYPELESYKEAIQHTYDAAVYSEIATR